MQVPDRVHVQQLAAEAARACERAIAGLPDEWAFHTYLGKMRSKAGAHTCSKKHLQWPEVCAPTSNPFHDSRIPCIFKCTCDFSSIPVVAIFVSVLVGMLRADSHDILSLPGLHMPFVVSTGLAE